MAFRIIIFLLFSSCNAHPVSAQPLGTWMDHLPYMRAKNVSAAANKIICTTPYALFTVDLGDNTIERLSKVNGLSEAGIAVMETDSVYNKTIIAYNSSNIDILSADRIINLDEIRRSNISVQKEITAIYFYKDKAYLAAAFGIVLIDLLKEEIRETYVIGASGKQVKVNQVAANDQFIYAATDEGVKRAPSSSVNLSDFRNWQDVNGGWSDGKVNGVSAAGGSIIIRKADSLFVGENNTWKFFYTTNLRISDVNVSSGKLIISESDERNARIVVLNSNGVVQKVYEQPGLIISPQEAIIKDNEIWIADASSGLMRSSGSSFISFRPNSPYSISTGEMVYDDGSFWVTSGIPSSGWEPSFSKNGFFKYNQQNWKNYPPSVLPALDSMYDLVTVAVSNKDHAVWIGSFGAGLLRFSEKESLQVFKQASGISSSLSNPDQYQVAGLRFDADFNLWISNYGAREPLVVRKNDGSFKKFTAPFPLNMNAVSEIVIDDFNQKWIVSPQGNGVLLYNHGASIDNTGDDQWKFYRTGKGNGNLPDNDVLSIARDKSGFIWIGTKRGIGIVQCPGQAFSGNSCEAILPVVQQDNFAGYLFSNEEVQAIAVNGADQKWIGTKHGAWLITSDGEKTIQHFTEDNSPLLSNDVRKIAIDPKTGDVFFATTKGICSFRGNAIEGNAVNDQVMIFPNPVPPGYNGSIAVRGIV
jgi:hypothetical protein